MLSTIVFDCFFRGALIGLIFGVPIGAIGVITFQRTVEQSPLCGLATGMSSAFVDFVYGFIAIYGLSMVCDIHSIQYTIGFNTIMYTEAQYFPN